MDETLLPQLWLLRQQLLPPLQTLAVPELHCANRHCGYAH